MEDRYCSALGEAIALDDLEKDPGRLDDAIMALKDCLGLFAYNRPKPTFARKSQTKTYHLLRNEIVSSRGDEEYKVFHELEQCGLMKSDTKIEDDPFKEPDMTEKITFWATEQGFKWLSEKMSGSHNTIRFETLEGPVTYLTKEHKKQAEAYRKRDKIRVGDRFIWKRSDTRKDEYITSGRLRDEYMYSPDFPYEVQGVLEVYKVYEGENGYGPFVDYWLKMPEKDPKEYHIIINAVEAMKMQRKKEES